MITPPDWAHNPQTQRHLRFLRDNQIVPMCPECGRQAKSYDGTFGVKHVCCFLVSWNYKPLQTQATLTARRRAHKAFDPLWAAGGPFRSRNDAYAWLADQLGMTRKRCHMALMTEDEANAVTKVCSELIGAHP